MDLPTRIRRGAQGVSSRIGTRNNGGRLNTEPKKPTQRLTERIRACKRSLSDLILGPSKSPDSLVTAGGQENNGRVALPVAQLFNSSHEVQEVTGLSSSKTIFSPDDAEDNMGFARDQMDAQYASTLRDLTGVGSHLPPAYNDRGTDQNRKHTDASRDSIVGHRCSDEFNANPSLSSPRSTFGYPTRTSSCTTTSSKSEVPEWGLRHKRFSSLWAHESFIEGSTTDSIFSGRAQSTISISSIGTIEAPITATTDEARPSAMKRQRLSSSSTGTLSSSYNEVNLDEHPLPTPPSSAGLRNFRKSIDRSDTESLNIASQLQPFEKATKKAGSERPERPVLKIEPVSGLLNIGEMDEETSAKPLSVISEGNSDAALSFMEASPVQPSGPFELLPVPSSLTRSSRRSFSDSTSEIPNSLASPMQVNSTRATSIAEQSEFGDISETESLGSDEISETDDPFLEAFSASSLDPNLLPFILNLKDHLVGQVASRVVEWVRSHALGSGESESGGFSSGSLSPHDLNGSGSKKYGRKRSFFGTGSNNSEREDGDEDQGKRRRTEPDIYDKTEETFFACPFTKRYPEKKWPKCHKKAFKEVHRIKEHIYRTHMLPLHCERCFTEFETDAERATHQRQTVPCDVVDHPADMIGVTSAIKEKLKSRKGKQNWKEDLKWKAMYQILFEDQTDIPDPYFEFDRSVGPMSQTQCTQFLRQQSTHCEREIRGLLEQRLHDEPGYEILRGRVLETIREAFDIYFTNITPPTPSEAHRSEEGQSFQKSKSPNLSMSPLELNALSKKNTPSRQSLSIDDHAQRKTSEDELLSQNNQDDLLSKDMTGNLSPQTGCGKSTEMPESSKEDVNSDVNATTCPSAHGGVIQEESYEPPFSFSQEIEDSFDFYRDSPFDFLGEDNWDH